MKTIQINQITIEKYDKIINDMEEMGIDNPRDTLKTYLSIGEDLKSTMEMIREDYI